MRIDRRRFIGAAAGAAAIGGIGTAVLRPKHWVDYRKPRSSVAILHCERYSGRLEELLLDGLKLFSLDVRGKSVLLKPNLVEDLPGPVNTHSVLIGAAARSFLQLGAKRVVIGEGPGNQRDTELVVHSARLEEQLREPGIAFVDLNRDQLKRVKLKAGYSGLGDLWLPQTVLTSDLIVSMPKVKTHHWAGVTLSLKNMFGIVPGMKYGWPKNALHWSGIHQSIVDICATVPVNFVIADGITAMEGNGPLQGTARRLNKLVLADDPVAADGTCVRLMGLEPRAVQHILVAADFLGNLHESKINMLAETVPRMPEVFSVLPDFRYLIRTS